MTITGFVRLEVGEGIEKKEEDFAAEVAKAGPGLISKPAGNRIRELCCFANDIRAVLQGRPVRVHGLKRRRHRPGRGGAV